MQGSGAAGSLVVAVMESAGYLAQSNILQWFENFWKFGGAFIYMLSVVGAVFSVAIFGSYAWGRYLLLAPVLFWFLTNTRQEIDFVTWQLGGSPAQGVEHVIDQAMVDRDEELRTALKQELGQSGAGAGTLNPDGTSTFSKKANVSWFFNKTAKLSSAIVNGIVDQILFQETNDDLMLATKATILQFFINAKPEDAQTYQMFAEVYFGECLKSTEVQMRLAQPRYSNLRNARIAEQIKDIESSPSATLADRTFADTLKQRYGELLRESNALKKDLESLSAQRFLIPRSMQEFFSRMAHGRRVNPLDPNIKYAEAIPNLGNVQLSCTEMADVVAHKFIEEGLHRMGDAFTKHFNNSSTKKEDLEETRQNLCLEIAGKIHPLSGPDSVQIDSQTHKKRDCNLSETIAIFMMRQVLLQQDISQRVIQQSKNRAEFAPSETNYVDIDALKKDGSRTKLNEEEFRNLTLIKGSSYGVDKDGTIHIRSPDGKYRRLISKPIKGLYSVFYGPAQTYATKEIQYDIFAGATKIPYYQGVLLYLLAASFPFLALLVLVPGHAQAFLNVPLTWFWLKSWDIGYACVIVMDKILWNLLPSTEIKEKIYTGGVNDPVNHFSAIPSALQAAMATTDPTYDIHVNFNYTAMALYAVPAITGYAILKGKKSILASFTQGPRSTGKEAGSIAGSGFGLGQINKNIQRLGDQGIYATWAQGGVGDNGRASRAMWDGAEGSAGMTAGGDLAKKGVKWGGNFADSEARKKMGKNPLRAGSQAIDDAVGAGVTASKKYRSLVTKEYMLDVAEGYAHDKDFGTASYSAKQHRVIGGMLDGARRFELEEMEYAGNIMEAKHRLFMEKFWTREEAIWKDGMSVVGAVGNKLKSESKPLEAIQGIGGAAVASDNLYRAMNPSSSNVDMYKDQGLMEQAGASTSWKPFSNR